MSSASIRPEVTACANSFNDLHERMNNYKATVVNELESDKSTEQLINFNLDYAISKSGFEYINAGFQDAVAKCKNITEPSIDEIDVFAQAYIDLIRGTRNYLVGIIGWMNIARELVIIQERPQQFHDTMEKLLKEQARTIQFFKHWFPKVVPIDDMPISDGFYQEIDSAYLNIIGYFDHQYSLGDLLADPTEF